MALSDLNQVDDSSFRGLCKSYCATCGVQFAFPRVLYNVRIESGDGVYCPNGHENFYSNHELRDAELLAIHKAEQAEAKIADLEARLAGTTPGAEPPTPDDYKEAGGWRCPKCKKLYKLAGCFGGHMRRVHRIEPTTGEPIVSRQ